MAIRGAEPHLLHKLLLLACMEGWFRLDDCVLTLPSLVSFYDA